MKIGYDREEAEAYGKKYTAVILTGKLNEDGTPIETLPVAGMPAIEGLMETAKAAGIEDIAVVAETDSEKLAPAIAEAVRAGKASGSKKEGCLVMPSEFPLISVSVLRKMMAELVGRGENPAAAAYEGKTGFPVYVPADMTYDECMDTDSMLKIETGEEGCILSTETKAGYADIKAFAAKGFRREKLELLTARKRIFLVEHGNGAGIESAAEEIAALMAEDVEAEKLGMDRFGKEPMPAIERIYSEDSAYAREAAEIIRKKVNELLDEPVEVMAVRGLCDDGNRYDMQYRVLRDLRTILSGDDAKDIIIITHGDALRALENNIKGLRIDDEWETAKAGEFRMLEPFPEQPREKVHGDKPMNMNDLTMEAVLEYYD